MSEFNEKFLAFFFTMLMFGCGFLLYKSHVDKVDCTKSALTQNRSVEDIRAICR